MFFTNHESRITNHESRITNHESRITNHESRITNHESRITNHESRITIPYAQEYPCFAIGTERKRSPVASKIALHTAGKIAGSAGSPKPVGGLAAVRKWTSISGGACVMRTGGY